MALIIPKNNAELATLDATLKIYYDADDWVDNATLISSLSQALRESGKEDEKKEPQSYTKKTQVLAYFGFITWENLQNNQSRRKITDLGKKFYEARISGNRNEIIRVLIESLQTNVFGRNVIGCNSDSDIEPPNVFIRASLLLGGLNNQQFAFILDQMENEHKSFSDALLQLKLDGIDGITATASEDAQKWADPKPITALKNWGLIDSSTGKIPQDIVSNYGQELLKLKVLNNVPNAMLAELDTSRQSGPEDQEDDDDEDFVELPLEQTIFYGVPGCGKSHSIENEIKKYPKKNSLRVVFHPEYSNTDFIGQILPKSENVGDISYEFTPGPFTNILLQAYIHRGSYCLVIEEINRGNAAAIFGDTFQLLDRELDGWSKYSVVNDNIKNYLTKIKDGNLVSDSLSPLDATNILAIIDRDNGIRLPRNLSILATMNTSDQNVFTLDNAFQRRFDMKLIKNEFPDSTIKDDDSLEIKKEKELIQKQKDAVIQKLDLNWSTFQDEINKKISELSKNRGLSSMEDKRIGCWFVKNNGETPSKILGDVFANKVLKYLWDDAFKFDRDKVFVSKYDSLESLITGFEKNENIFVNGVLPTLDAKQQQATH